MKTLIFSMLAIVTFHATTLAQGTTFSKSAMVTLVAGASGSYKKGMPYKEWVDVLVGSSSSAELTAAESKFLADTYKYLSASATSESIFNTYDGASFNSLMFEKRKGVTGALNGSNQRCGLWCQFLIWVVITIGDLMMGPTP